MTVTYGAFVVSTLNAAPRGLTFTRKKMNGQGRKTFVNPRLRDAVERDVAEIAYALRKHTKVGSIEYRTCSDACDGHLSMAGLAILKQIDERAGTGLLRSFGKGLPSPTENEP